MNNVRFYLLKKDNQYIINESSTSTAETKSFCSIHQIFLYLYEKEDKLSFLDIYNIFKLNNLEFDKCDLLKYFIDNSESLNDSDAEVYLRIKISKGSIYEILSITSKSSNLKKSIKGASLTLKIKKQHIPIYLAIFLKDYTIKDYYKTLKSICKDTKLISYIDLYGHNKEYYVVKNRDKIIYIATTKKLANYYVNIISNIRKDNSSYFVPNIEIVSGFKNLINYLQVVNGNISIDINDVKNIVDFTNEYIYTSKEHNPLNTYIDIPQKSYVIKNKDNGYSYKESMETIFDFIIKNKIYSPEIIELYDIKRVLSKKEVFKSVFLSNIIEEKEDLNTLNGISILSEDNLIKIYSNIVNILFFERTSYPYIANIYDNTTQSYDVLFFFDKTSMDGYILNKNKEVIILKSSEISLKSISEKFIEKNMEILMKEYEDYNQVDVAINLSSLYKKDKENAVKIKQLSEINLIVDVDSSLCDNVASCGVVFRDSSDKILCKISREVIAKTSVEAEIRGAMYAIRYAIMENFTEICLRYDYIGIFEYLIVEPTSELIEEYQAFFNEVVNNYDIEIYFKKVKAHSQDKYNELADYLAGHLNIINN